MTWTKPLPSSVAAGDPDHAGIHNKTTDALAEVRTRVDSQARDELGLYVPAGWGSTWRTKRELARTGNGRATIAVVGSSSTQGYHSSDPLTKGYVGSLRKSLQQQYGNGGSGYFTAANSPFIVTAGANTTWGPLAGRLTAVTGTWTLSSYVYGPSGVNVYATVPGNSITFQVEGTSIRIYTISGGGRSNFTYSIDGATAVPVADAAASTVTVQVTSVTASAGVHTVKLTHNGSNGQFFSVCGVSGENTTGVVVNNFGVSGYHSAEMVEGDPKYGAAAWSGGPNYTADLALYVLGANDANDGIAGDAWALNLRKYLQTVRDGTSLSGSKALGDTDVMIVLQHIGNHDTANLKFQDYSARVRGIAASYGAAVVDFWALGKTSWNYWNSLGYWGNASSLGAVGTDAIHMSDAGHKYFADTLLPLLTA